MHYVVLLESGHTFITTVEPEIFVDENRYAVACETIDHALAVQGLAIAAKITGEAQTGLRIAKLEDEIAIERTKTRDRETVLNNVMGALALDMALERTHQQRNAEMRHIVRLIKRILVSVDDGMDDVPF